MLRAITPDDFSTISDWYSSRGLRFSPEWVSDIGYIVDGVAAIFLIPTSSKVCLLDGCITNKDSSTDERDKALDAILVKLSETAAELGFKYAIGLVASSYLHERLRKHRFNKMGVTPFIKQLK